MSRSGLKGPTMSHRNSAVERRSLPTPPRAPLVLAHGQTHTATSILRAWLEGKSEHTIRNYRHDLDAFAGFLSESLRVRPPFTVDQALTRLFRESSPSAHEIVLAFRQYLDGLGMAPATINRHLATLRSVAKLARMLGAIPGGWIIEVRGVPPEQRRDTRGPSIADVRAMLEASNGDTEGETRDHAIVLMCFALGLRAGEVCGLNLEETDLARGTAWIHGKGRRERELVPLPESVVTAIRRYLRWRGTESGPLFQTRGQRGTNRDGRLDTRSVLRIVRLAGERVGVRCWPHALRHASITVAAELGQRAGLGLDKIRAHSRHRSLATLQTYIDDRDQQRTRRTLADLVAGSISGG